MSERVLLEAHAHTREASPCGKLWAAELVEALHEKGYGAFFVTDHFTENVTDREAYLSGFRNAKRAAEGLGMIALPGIEIRFAPRPEDYLVYGMEETDILNLPEDVCHMSLRDFHNLARERGWLVYQAHPYRPEQRAAIPIDLDGVEIFNGNPRHDSQNRRAASFATRSNLRTIAGGDVHQRRDAGIVGLLVPEDALAPKAFADWLRATPHPSVKHQEAPVEGIRYLAGPIPGKRMLEALYRDAGWLAYADDIGKTLRGLENSRRVVTAWDDTQLVGMARSVGDGETILYVQDLLVLGQYRRRGIGRALMRRLLADAKVRQTVLVTDDNARNRSFYQKCGFHPLSDAQCMGYIKFEL